MCLKQRASIIAISWEFTRRDCGTMAVWRQGCGSRQLPKIKLITAVSGETTQLFHVHAKWWPIIWRKPKHCWRLVFYTEGATRSDHFIRSNEVPSGSGSVSPVHAVPLPIDLHCILWNGMQTELAGTWTRTASLSMPEAGTTKLLIQFHPQQQEKCQKPPRIEDSFAT